jgi:hypothetical protein
MAAGVVKGLLRGREGNVPAAEILRSMELEIPSPELPAWIRLWREAERTSAESEASGEK